MQLCSSTVYCHLLGTRGVDGSISSCALASVCKCGQLGYSCRLLPRAKPLFRSYSVNFFNFRLGRSRTSSLPSPIIITASGHTGACREMGENSTESPGSWDVNEKQQTASDDQRRRTTAFTTVVADDLRPATVPWVLWVLISRMLMTFFIDWQTSYARWSGFELMHNNCQRSGNTVGLYRATFKVVGVLQLYRRCTV